MPRVRLNSDERLHERRKLLYQRYGGFMTIQNVMSELGVSRNTAKKFTASLTAYQPTGKPMYDITDVARKIEEARVPKKEETT